MAAIDLTDLMQLVAVFNGFLQAFLPLILIGVFIGFVIALAGGGKLLGKLTFAVPSSGSKIIKPRRRKTRAIKIGTLAILGLLILSMGSTPGAAVGGSVSLGTTQVFAGTPITVTASDLDASTAYAIFYDSVAKFNWTSAATAKDMVITFEATAPSGGGNSVDVVLYSADTTVETLTLYLAEASGFLPTSFIIQLGVAMMIIGVITLIVIAIVKKR